MVLAGAAWFAGDLSDALAVRPSRAARAPAARLSERAVALARGRAPWSLLAYVDGLVPALARSTWPTIALMAAIVVAAAARYRARRRRRAPRAGRRARRSRGDRRDARVRGDRAARRRRRGHGGAVGLLRRGRRHRAAGLTADLLWGRWTRAAVTGLVIDLGDHHEPQALRAALARTLGDPGAAGRLPRRGRRRLGRRDRPAGRRAAGRRAGRAASRSCTRTASRSRRCCTIPRRSRTASSRRRWRPPRASPSRTRGMQAQIAARLREVDASRRRLVEAGDDERRRLGEELHTGVERRLDAISARLAALAAGRDGEPAVALRRLSAELDEAREDLRRFAAGHPSARAHRARPRRGPGRAGRPRRAFRSRSPCPRGGSRPRTRRRCSSSARRVWPTSPSTRARPSVDIAVTATDERLVVRVADDGCGGADPARGSGLRGLADRVQALGGTLRVRQPGRRAARASRPSCRSPGEPAVICDDRAVLCRRCSRASPALRTSRSRAATVAIVRGEPELALAGGSAAALAAELAAGAAAGRRRARHRRRRAARFAALLVAAALAWPLRRMEQPAAPARRSRPVSSSTPPGRRCWPPRRCAGRTSGR